MGRGGSKKCKPIPAPPRGAGLKSRPIPAPLPLRGGENPHGAKRGGTGQAGRGKIAIPKHTHQSFATTTTTCLGFHNNTTHPQIHNSQIQTNPPPQIDPSQPPPPVLGFTAAQHTHKSTTHKSKPTHHPKPIIRRLH